MRPLQPRTTDTSTKQPSSINNTKKRPMEFELVYIGWWWWWWVRYYWPPQTQSQRGCVLDTNENAIIIVQWSAIARARVCVCIITTNRL